MSFPLPVVASRLIVGTVQFGLPYGVTNSVGRVPLHEARAILADAEAAGIEQVDTAASYGSSEEVLGACLPSLPRLGVITKTLAITETVVTDAAVERIAEGVMRSIAFLRRPKLNALLLHHASDLLKPGGERLTKFLLRQKADGKTEKIGVSVYDARDIDGILKTFRPDVIQLPLNLFDQSLIQSGHIRMLRDEGIEIHARSAFLQGVLLANPSQLPENFRAFSAHFEKYQGFLRETGLTPLHACLGFMFQQSGADRVVIGVTSRNEFSEILQAMTQARSLPAMSELASSERLLTDPRRWTPVDISEVSTS